MRPLSCGSALYFSGCDHPRFPRIMRFPTKHHGTGLVRLHSLNGMTFGGILCILVVSKLVSSVID